MRLYLLFSLIILTINFSIGQELYYDSIYKKIDKNTYEYTTITNETLEFDFYRAKDAKGKLPLVIYVHGGGFSMGERDNRGIIYFGKRLAARGYAFASVSYRLTMKDIGLGCDVTADQKRGAIDNAAQDVLQAIKRIVKDAQFEIDPDKIILIGSSAGAETVLQLAFRMKYMDSLDNHKFAGVISMAGAMIDVNDIDFENAIPTQLFHGTGDAYVPYHVAPHHYCGGDEPGFLMLYGAGLIAQRLKGLGTAYFLYSIVGGSHEWSGKPTKFCFTEIVDFMYNDVLYPNILRQTERTISIK